jgi:hypothetical protein
MLVNVRIKKKHVSEGRLVLASLGSGACPKVFFFYLCGVLPKVQCNVVVGALLAQQ